MDLVQSNVADKAETKERDEEEGGDQEKDIKGHVDLEQGQSKSCCNRFRYEICKGKMFDINEPNGQVIDIEKSFSPLFNFISYPKLTIILVRIGILAAAITSLVLTAINDREYWFIYVTNWSFFFSIAYFTCSILISIYRKCLLQTDNLDARPHPLVLLTWALYALATPLELVITLLYWALVYEGGTIRYYSLFNHGIFMLLLLIDGLILARIPIRMKQIIPFQVVAITYLIWTIIHTYANIGTNGSSDLIYDVLDYRNKPGTSCMYLIVIILVVNPIMFIILWIMSVWSKCCTFDGGRRHLYNASLS